MHIDLPDDVSERIKRVAENQGSTPADIVRRALDSLAWYESERAAIQIGIDALEEGRFRDYDDFDREFRMENGIPPVE
jgi:predicted transcriptional regulator